MKYGFVFFLMTFCCLGGFTAAEQPDFIVSDIAAQPDQFIHIKLQNRSPVNFQVSPEMKEKIFLTIYINDIKRAEYKLKYIDQKLFKPKSTILFRTNFRMQEGLRIKVEVNPLKIIPEANFLNNTLTKQLTSRDKQ
jgi:hypothetical protein